MKALTAGAAAWMIMGVGCGSNSSGTTHDGSVRGDACIPDVEVCNGRDDNCDGVADDGFDLMTDALNCGACGQVCPGNGPHSIAACVAGACSASASTCFRGWSDCDHNSANGCETQLNTPTNCGACGAGCSIPNAQASCDTGACELVQCQSPFADCNGMVSDGCEADLRTSATCGSCGVVCGRSTPFCNRDNEVFACASSCSGSTPDHCGPECVSKQNDPRNCGACGTECSSPHSMPACTAGVCTLGPCDMGFQDCDGDVTNGCESISATDLAHCGSCGNACPMPANATATCLMGVCGGTCQMGFVDCDQNLGNGCEIDERIDPTHCGSCTNVCPMPPNAAPTCARGVCGRTCLTGFADCDADSIDGCETNTQTDATRCGSCGHACPIFPNTMPICTAGACGFTCLTGFADCDNDPTNGCEVDTRVDTGHCGTCATRCAVPANSMAMCAAGVCVSTCNQGFADCDLSSANGCEVNTQTDLVNCGMCANACPVPTSGVATCTAGVCGGMCSPGYGDCNGNLALDGCETFLSGSDVSNCGGCGAGCPAYTNSYAYCSGGACGAACNPGFGDCGTGSCSVDFSSNAGNCGGCGMACGNPPHAVGSCSSGSCTSTCIGPYIDCTGAPGCETDSTTDVNHCGSCTACNPRSHAGIFCNGGSCDFNCQANFGDCDGYRPNGCERPLANDILNCGLCGYACPGGANTDARTCSNGNCGWVCTAGWQDCNPFINGCETRLRDHDNCGSCGNNCGGRSCTSSLICCAVLSRALGAGGTGYGASAGLLVAVALFARRRARSRRRAR